ncbi:iron complex transport system permease protein [Bowdeniella nasicola]|uniref:Iron complex transport system permease protein n=1 Tax=Bowdeniella nasicola TaxID=208480 RepID=A0A1H4AD05_9ACTO|nr:iron ABC transporter permease [Bowdeniella nasicola]SEA33790.1 iron complex transport system permease protein [Bowdeniella nasicola]
MTRPATRAGAIAAGAIIASAALTALHLLTGTPALTPSEILAGFAAPPEDSAHIIVAHIRAPRIVLALAAGAALALAGALLQDALRNPLAAPELLGVSGGAALIVALIAIAHVPVPRAATPLAALLGALGIGAAVISAGSRARESASLLLIGVAAATFLSGSVIAVITLGNPSDVGLFYQFLLGSLANRSWDAVTTVAPLLALAAPLALALAPSLNVLRLGDTTAAGLGVRVRAVRLTALVCAAALTAGVVAVAGPIGFVALLAPHIARALLATHDARWVLPTAAAIGATLLLGADTLGRALLAPREVAVGVWTVLLGAPGLLALLRRREHHP